MRFDNFSGSQYNRAALRVPSLPIVAFLPQASALQTKQANWFCTAACIHIFILYPSDSHWTIRPKSNEERISFCKCSLYDITFERRYLDQHFNEYCLTTHSNIWKIFSHFNMIETLFREMKYFKRRHIFFQMKCLFFQNYVPSNMQSIS